MARQCCCGCWIRTDDFNRTASSDLGDNWYELEGDWGLYSVFAFELVEDYTTITHSRPSPPEGTGTADSILIYTEPEPESSAGEMYIELYVYMPSVEVGDVYRLYPCCPTDHSVGSTVAEFTYLGDYLADGHVYWQIDITDGGTTDSHISQITEDPTPTLVLLYVCSDHEIGMTRGGVMPSENQTSTWIIADAGEGRYGAIGHNVESHLVVFDNFEIGELRTPTEVCQACFCMCDLIPMPQQLTGTFVHTNPSYSTRLSCLEGLTWTMDYVEGLSSPIWSGYIDITTVETPAVVQRVTFTLNCTSGWTLNITVSEYNGSAWVAVPAACFDSIVYPAPSMVSARTEDETPTPDYWSTCDPISLVYGPWIAAIGDDCNWCYKMNDPLIPCLMNFGNPLGGPVCQGEFWIIFTETP